LSQPKLKPPPEAVPHLLLNRGDSQRHVIWGMVAPHGEESCRWQTGDGRWVALTVGRGTMLGKVIVATSDGRCRILTSYEAALHLAREWRD
jgi:hypothetical protein